MNTGYILFFMLFAWLLYYIISNEINEYKILCNKKHYFKMAEGYCGYPFENTKVVSFNGEKLFDEQKLEDELKHSGVLNNSIIRYIVMYDKVNNVFYIYDKELYFFKKITTNEVGK